MTNREFLILEAKLFVYRGNWWFSPEIKKIEEIQIIENKLCFNVDEKISFYTECAKIALCGGHSALADRLMEESGATETNYSSIMEECAKLCAWEGNYENTMSYLAKAKARGKKLVCLLEECAVCAASNERYFISKKLADMAGSNVWEKVLSSDKFVEHKDISEYKELEKYSAERASKEYNPDIEDPHNIRHDIQVEIDLNKEKANQNDVKDPPNINYDANKEEYRWVRVDFLHV